MSQFGKLKKTRLRQAYTLLELLLALGVSVVIVAAITTAITVYLVSVQRHQRRIEQKQVARNVLTMIANDLRAGLQFKAADVSGIENLEASQDLIAGVTAAVGGEVPADATDTDTADEGASGSDASSSSGGDTSGEAEDSEEDTASYRPTLVGNSSVINVDISRLPRLDQYLAIATGGDIYSQTGSDVKSINYMVSSAAAPNEAGFDPQVSKLGGLYRRQIDRAIANYAGEMVAPNAPDNNSQLIAPEIIEIGFRYFDGSSWQDSWNSEENGFFPLAIEVTIVLDPNRIDNALSGKALSAQDMFALETYRGVVHLPSAEVPPEEAP
ncbi:MAG: hypothetical protein R3C03_02395 [Pirellulaceae bacterium]